MDIDAALKDGYSLAEVNAEAARRVGFDYEAAKADGYSDEDIIGELRNRVKTPKPVEKDIGDGEGLLDKAVGVGQAAASVITGGIGGLLAPIPTALQAANEYAAGRGKDFNFEKQLASNMERFTYEPSREKGQEYAQEAGEFVNRNLIPIAPLVQMQALGRLQKPKMPVSRPGVNEVPTSRVANIIDQLKKEEPFKGQGELFPETLKDTSGHASSYDAGRMGVSEPISPLRSRRQQELPLNNEIPAQLDIDAAGVSIPPEQARVVDLAKQQALDQLDAGVQAERLNAQQADLFEPQTNMFRDFTDKLVDDGKGGQRPMTKAEYAETIDKLANEPGTAFVKPENIDAGYETYLKTVDENQGGLFETPSRQERFNENIYQDQVPNKASQHPFVKKAADKVTKQEIIVLKLQDAIEQGRPMEAQLTRAIKDLEALEKAETTVRTNIENSLAKKEPLPKRPRKLNKQSGAIDPDVFLKDFPEFVNSVVRDAAGKLKVMYHGTSKDVDFKNIEPKQRGSFFTDNPKTASEYATSNDSQGYKYEDFKYVAKNTASRVIPVYLNVKNPMVLSDADKVLYREGKSYAQIQRELTAKAKALGHDGLDYGGGVLVAFDKEQIKSALSPKTIKSRGNRQGGGIKIDWRDNDKVDPLKKIPGIGDAVRDVGNALIDSPEQAIDLASTTQDVSQNIAQKVMNEFSKGGISLKQRVNNPVFHFTVDRLLEADGLAKAEISNKLQGVYLDSIRSLSKKDQVEAFTILNAADLYKKELTPEMLSQLPPKMQEFISVHQEIMRDALDKENIAREALGKKPIESRAGYSAMNMSGDFRKVAYKTIDGEKQVVGVIGANSKSMGKNSLSKLEASMKAKDPELEFGPLQDLTTSSRGSKGTPQGAFMDALQTLGEDNPNFKQFLDTLKEVAKDDPSNYMGMQKHSLGKKGVWGMEGRKPWLTDEQNATAFFENQVKYLEGVYNWSELSKAAQDVNKVLRDETVATKQQNAVKLSEEYMQNALGLNPSRVGRAAEELFNALFGKVGIGPSGPKEVLNTTRKIVNTNLLSLNTAFLGIQLLQAPHALPGVVAFLRGRGLSPKHTMLTQGFEYITQGGYTFAKELTGQKLSDIEKGALDFAKKNHIYATDLVEHSMQTSKNAAYYASKITQSPAAKIELGTRATVYMALVHMMNDAGLKPEQGLYKQAQRFTDMAMNNYGTMEKPAFYNALGPVGSMAYNLKSFIHNELSRWSTYAREISKTGNPVPLLTQMATTLTFAGMMGVPFFSQLEDLYDFITKELASRGVGQPRSLALDVMEMSEKIGKHFDPKGETGVNGLYALSNGAGSLLGVDISKRVGLGDAFPSSLGDAAFAGGGKLIDVAKAAARTAMKPNEENAKALVMGISPSIVSGPLDTQWYQKGNLAYSKDPEKLKPVAERNAADVLYKKIGFTGINEASQKQREYQLGELTKRYSEYRQSAMNSIAQDLFNDRPISQKAVEKYFKIGQGDPQSFETELKQMAIKQNMSPQQYNLARQAASQRIPQLRALERRIQ